MVLDNRFPHEVMTSTDSGNLPIEELPRRVRATGKAATASGALVPIATRVRLLEDAGLPFAVRVSEGVARKESAGENESPDHDPFAPPYEPDLHVGGISDSHVVLLNKYNVLPGHLLLVTRADLPQTCMLDTADFEAALLALAAFDGLVFYNGGREAGASQSHKHLQLVPLPLTHGPNPMPFSPLLEALELEHGIACCRELPFRHSITTVTPQWWRSPNAHAPSALAAWQELWRWLGHEVVQHAEQPMPYNLLMTREWMWLVPRSRRQWEGIGVNALGYTGALLVRDEAQYEHLLRVGLTRLLSKTGVT